MPQTVAMTVEESKEAAIEAVRRELTALRQRGFYFLDGSRNQPPLHLPLLEAMAGRFLGAGAPLDRGEMLELYLGKTLVMYRALYARRARFIEPLFFDPRPEEKRIGMLKSGDLLDLERRALYFTKRHDREFRELREVHFRQFARFMIDIHGTTPMTEADKSAGQVP
jgi:hypothetical protein